MFLEWLPTVMLLAGVAVSVWLVQYNRQGGTEWRSLADVRGATIEDLQAQINTLKTEVDALRQEVKAYESMRVKDIIDGVVEGLAPFVDRTHFH